jgi:hypothetical protein
MSTPQEQQLQAQLVAQTAQFNQQAASMQQEVTSLRAQLQQLQSASQSGASSSSSSSGPSGPQQQPQGGAPFKPQVRLMTPSSFHGNTGNANNGNQWLEEVERYFVVAGVEDPHRVPFASTYLKDTASLWYTALIAECESVPTWEDFKLKFKLRFQPLAASKIARATIRTLKHRYKVAGYNQEFLKCMQLIDDMSVADQIDIYITGLQQHVAMEVDRKDPKTLSEAMDAAQRAELMSNHRKANSSGGSSSYARMPFSYNSRSQGGGSSGNHGGDSAPMDLSALQQEDLYDEPRGNEMNPQAFAQEAYQHFVAAVYNRGGPSRGGFRGRSNFHPGRGGGMQPRRHHAPNLSAEEFDKLQREGKCFNCKEGNHLARNCPKNSKSNASSSTN